MRELSIFVDESGDFGSFEPHAPYYIFTLVFHDQKTPIQGQLLRLEAALRHMGYEEDHCFHVGPIIIIVYYDNGQVELNKVLASVFTVLLSNVEFRKVYPAEYRLFQAADLICAMELIERKMQKKSLSKSEQLFFGTLRDLKKNYLKPIERMRFHEI